MPRTSAAVNGPWAPCLLLAPGAGPGVDMACFTA
jgi:hypothetical protein